MVSKVGKDVIDLYFSLEYLKINKLLDRFIRVSKINFEIKKKILCEMKANFITTTILLL